VPAKADEMRDRDSETGEYNESYPLKLFIKALDKLDGDVGTKDVEELVGCEYRTTLAKLQELEDNDLVTSRRVGNAYLWSLAERTESESPQVGQETSDNEGTSDENEDPMAGGIYDPTQEHY
jgi:hypothetical protein